MIGRIQLDWALITALIERWRPKTHTFHLPIGEATITLQDAEILYGLSVDGLPVLLPATMIYYSRQSYCDMLHMLTGFRPEDETVASGSSRMQLVPIRDHLEQIHHTITDESVEVDVQRYTRLPLLLLLRGVLFPNTSGNLVSLRFLHHIGRIEDTAIYSWGGAVISYLYKQMCRACIDTQRDVSGFLPLLQPIPSPPVWLALHYERDDRSRADDTFMAWIYEQLGTWDRRGELTPPPQHFPIQHYMAWYCTVSRLFIGNPVHQ
uniref:Serine/threonine-protein phosphatase 7 long form homolog n=1 Tax=Nicotiana tabacum TaxID=4097 RepID=A0A1S3XA84_TOBAC